jgi:hypothetical protein
VRQDPIGRDGCVWGFRVMLEWLTTDGIVGTISNMTAEPLAHERHVLAESLFAEIVIWRVPEPVKGSAHRFKYRLALVADGECVLRYDNEAGKGDHRHVGGAQTVYSFTNYRKLLADFWADVEAWRHR